MRTKFVILLVALLFLAGAFVAYKAVQAQSRPTGKGGGLRVMNTQEQITKLLNEFLAGVDKPETHDRFWSDDLVYTGGKGTLRTKAEIMKDVREGAAKPVDPKEPKTTYEAQDVKIKDYGDFAVLNFHLVAHSEQDGKPATLDYRNTGTLRKENGEWKVIAWQATKIEPTK
jgi:ketosteroid isomerase-like protein